MDFKVPTVLLGRKKRAAEASGDSQCKVGPGGAQVELTEPALNKADDSSDSHNSPLGIADTEQKSDEEGSPIAQPSSDGVSKASSSVKDTKDEAQAPKVPLKPSNPSLGGSHATLQYSEPRWSGAPSKPFSLMVIKHGAIVGEVGLSDKPYHTFGRLPHCDVTLEHPSLSRYHALVQYRPPIEGEEHSAEQHTLFSTNPQEEGFYVYDLGSTHGTLVNKTKIQPRCYYRLRVGQNVRFGGSSRMFVLQSSASQEEVEAEAEAEIRSILHHKGRLEARQAAAIALEEQQEREREEMGASWGMALDDIALPSSTEGGQDIDIDPEKEAYYVTDPKKALRKFFDREGLELEYETEEEGEGRTKGFTVRVRLPIDTVSGEGVYAEASVKGKKKEAVLQCALNACRMLDANDMLRGNTQSHKRKRKNWEDDDYYDSDDDTFLDRTGAVERKRKQRMKQAGVLGDAPLTYQTLQTDLDKVHSEMLALEAKLAKSDQAESAELSGDSLDAYMSTLGNRLDKTKKAELKHQLLQLKKEEERIKKLMTMAKPTELPALASPSVKDNPVETAVSPNQQSSKSYLAQLKAKYGNPSQETLQRSETDHSTTVENPDRDKASRLSSNSPKDADGSATAGRSLSTSSEPGEDISPSRPEQGHPRKRRRKSRTIGPTLPPQLTSELEKSSKAQNDPDYSDWLPPDHQTGDGRTHLNEKFGY